MNHELGYKGCNDYIGWSVILNKLAERYCKLQYKCQNIIYKCQNLLDFLLKMQR